MQRNDLHDLHWECCTLMTSFYEKTNKHVKLACSSACEPSSLSQAAKDIIILKRDTILTLTRTVIIQGFSDKHPW